MNQSASPLAGDAVTVFNCSGDNSFPAFSVDLDFLPLIKCV